MYVDGVPLSRRSISGIVVATSDDFIHRMHLYDAYVIRTLGGRGPRHRLRRESIRDDFRRAKHRLRRELPRLTITQLHVGDAQSWGSYAREGSVMGTDGKAEGNDEQFECDGGNRTGVSLRAGGQRAAHGWRGSRS